MEYLTISKHAAIIPRQAILHHWKTNHSKEHFLQSWVLRQHGTKDGQQKYEKGNNMQNNMSGKISISVFSFLWKYLVHSFTGYMVKSKSSFRLANPSDALRTFLFQAPVVTICAPFHVIEGTDTDKNLEKFLKNVIPNFSQLLGQRLGSIHNFGIHILLRSVCMQLGKEENIRHLHTCTLCSIQNDGSSLRSK